MDSLLVDDLFKISSAREPCCEALHRTGVTSKLDLGLCDEHAVTDAWRPDLAGHVVPQQSDFAATEFRVHAARRSLVSNRLADRRAPEILLLEHELNPREHAIGALRVPALVIEPTAIAMLADILALEGGALVLEAQVAAVARAV